MRLRLLPLAHYLRRNGAALATIAVALLGWLLLTHGLVRAFDATWLWHISLGALALGLAGYRLVARVLRDGLYVLTRDDDSTPKD